jgi:hypothetical protein
MALHQLSSVTIGVPNVAETAGYYADFGLTDLGDGTFATIDGGRQLRIGQAPTRRIIDGQLWTPETLEGARGLFSWGPPPPPSFLHPEDLAALMTGSHAR